MSYFIKTAVSIFVDINVRYECYLFTNFHQHTSSYGLFYCIYNGSEEGAI